MRCPKINDHDFQFTGHWFGKRQCVKCNLMEEYAIIVHDETKVTEVTKKTKKWFNGLHEFDSIKTETPPQPTSLGINVGDKADLKDIVG